MAALTPAEKQIALAMYQEWIPPSEEHGIGFQTNPFWENTTPIKVLEAAATRIAGQVAEPVALFHLENDIAAVEWDINNPYDSFPDNPIMRLLGDGALIRHGAPQSDQDKLDRAIFEILRVGAPAAPAPPAVININRKELPEEDPILYRPFSEGQRVIRIGKRNNWLFDDDSLSKYWKDQGKKTNPLVSGFNGAVLNDSEIERGILHIVEESKGGRRRKTRKHSRRSRKTRRSRK
jgi:hypothetical protein